MQHDEVIWSVINHHFCSFKATIDDKSRAKQNFCRNENNVTGLCNRSSCPLANSRYATIREVEGRVFLYVKTIERAHSPKNLWEKIKLPRNYTKALALVSEQLEYFPKYLVHKNKQRLTKIHQYLIRMRKLALRVKPKLVRINKKVERRDRTRERKALSAAKIEKSIESELLERLKRGTYGSIYNFPEAEYEAALSTAEGQTEGAKGGEEEEDWEEEDESEAEVEYVEDFEDDEESDMEDWDAAGFDPDADPDSGDEEDVLRGKGKGKRAAGGAAARAQKRRRGEGGASGPRVEVEYEDEEEELEAQQTETSW